MADMISKNLDKANRLYSIGMKNIKLQLKQEMNLILS